MKPSGIYPTRLAGAVMLILLLIAPEALCSQASAGITAVSIRAESGEVELATEGAIEYGYFPLSEPDRLVFDFPGTLLTANDGEELVEEVAGAGFREIRLSQFSDDPPIARLVFYLTDPATAIVNFDRLNGRMVIRINTADTRRNLLFGQEDEPTEPEIQPAQPESPEAVATEPEEEEIVEVEVTSRPDPESVYEIAFTEVDVTITFPCLSADDVTVTQLRFPDRLHIRMFAAGPIGDERPRFESLARGNIWNDVAKQWASFLDRDGRGVIDLTIYLYPNVGYTQSILPGGIPEIRLFPVPQTPEVIQSIPEAPAPSPEIDEIPTAELEVSAYPEEITGDTETEPVPVEEIEEAVTTQEAVIEIPEPEETQIFAEVDTGTAGGTEQDTTGSVNIVSAVETMEIIDDGTLVSELPPVAPPPTETSGTVGSAGLTVPGTLGSLPLTLNQNDLLSTGIFADSIYMRVGEVIVLDVEELVRASLGNPAIAALNVLSQDELLVTALAPGSTTLLTWEMGRGDVVSRELNVLDATAIDEQQISAVIGDDDISVSILMSGEAEGAPGVILEGVVETEAERDRAHSIAALYAGERVTNLIEVSNPRQVMVKVRVVEIDRRALDEHLSQFSAAARADNDDFTIGIITDLLDPENPGGGLMDSRVRPGIINGEAEDVVFDPIDMVLNELETNRKANILSQPNVVAMSGHAATFRVGGEVPYTYLNENGVTVVEFKEFGISLDMTPIVDSHDNIMLTINPIVRTVDNALAIAGIPGFRTREMTTEVQLKAGETLVIGGLIQNEVTQIVSEVPLLSQIPVLGELFRSKRFNEDETELVIFLTPYLLEDAIMSHRIMGVSDLEVGTIQ